MKFFNFSKTFSPFPRRFPPWSRTAWRAGARGRSRRPPPPSTDPPRGGCRGGGMRRKPAERLEPAQRPARPCAPQL